MGRKAKKSIRDAPNTTTGHVVSVVPVLREKRDEFPLMSYLIEQRERLDAEELSEVEDVLLEGDVIGKLEIPNETGSNDEVLMSKRITCLVQPDLIRETTMTSERERALQKLHALESESRRQETEQLLASSSRLVGSWQVSPLPVKTAEQEYFPGTQQSKGRKKGRSSSRNNHRGEPFVFAPPQVVQEPPRHQDVGPQQLDNVWRQKPGSALFDKRDGPPQVSEEEELRWALQESTRLSKVNTTPYLCGSGDRWSTEVEMRPKIVGAQLQARQTLDCFVKVDKLGNQYIDKDIHHRPKEHSANNHDIRSSQGNSTEYNRSVALAQTVEMGLVDNSWDVEPRNGENYSLDQGGDYSGARGYQDDHCHRSNKPGLKDCNQRENTRHSQVDRSAKAKSDKKIPPLMPELDTWDDRNAPDRNHNRGRGREEVKPGGTWSQHEDSDEPENEDRRVKGPSRYDQLSRSERDKMERKGASSGRERRREQPKYQSPQHRQVASRVHSAEYVNSDHRDGGERPPTHRTDPDPNEKSTRRDRHGDRDVGDHKRKHVSQPNKEDDQKQGIDRQNNPVNGTSNDSPYTQDTKHASDNSQVTETNQTGALHKSSKVTEFFNQNEPQNEKRLSNKVPTDKTESQVQKRNKPETHLPMADSNSNASIAHGPTQDLSDTKPEWQTLPAASQNLMDSFKGDNIDLFELMQHMYHLRVKPSDVDVPNMQGQPGPDFSRQHAMPPQNLYPTRQQTAFQPHGGQQQFAPRSQPEGQAAVARIRNVQPEFNTWTPPTARGPQTKHKMQPGNMQPSLLAADGLPQLPPLETSHDQDDVDRDETVEEFVQAISNLCHLLQASAPTVGQPNGTEGDQENERILNAVDAVQFISTSPMIDPIVTGQCRQILKILLANQNAGRKWEITEGIIEMLVTLCETARCSSVIPSPTGEGETCALPSHAGLSPVMQQLPPQPSHLNEMLPQPPSAWVTGREPGLYAWQHRGQPEPVSVYRVESPRSNTSPMEMPTGHYPPNPHLQQQQHGQSLGMSHHVQYHPVDMAQFYQYHQQAGRNAYYAAQRAPLNPHAMPHYGPLGDHSPYGLPDPGVVHKVELPQPDFRPPRFSGPPGIPTVRLPLTSHPSVGARGPFSSSPRVEGFPPQQRPVQGGGM